MTVLGANVSKTLKIFMNNLSNRVGIIGGGIAGLTLGCTLLKEGIPAVIF